MRQAWENIVGSQETSSLQYREFLTFNDFLVSSKTLIDNEQLSQPTCFISYAWETNNAKNKRLHGILQFLQSNLEMLGATVYLDITHVESSLNNYMAERIAQSGVVFLIGTPRLKARLSEANDNAAKFEFAEITTKLKMDPNALIPLLFEGEFATAFPSTVMANLIRDCRGVMDGTAATSGMDGYIKVLSRLSNPLGIIPVLYGIQPGSPAYARYEEIVVTLDSTLYKLHTENQLKGIGKQQYHEAKQHVAQGNHEAAFTLLLIAAQTGHTKSMINVAKMLAYGQGTTTDVPEALSWAERAAREATTSQYELAQETLQQVQRKHTEMLANQGDVCSMEKLAHMLWQRQGMPQPENAQVEQKLNQQALAWAERAKIRGQTPVDK